MCNTIRLLFLTIGVLLNFLCHMAYSSEINLCNESSSRLTLSSIIDIDIESEKKYLTFKLQNISESDIRIFRSSLSRSNIVLIAITNRGEIVNEELFPDDLPAGEWRLEPNEQITSKIMLDPRFPDLDKVVLNREIIFFWSTRIQFVNGECSERITGSAIFE